MGSIDQGAPCSIANKKIVDRWWRGREKELNEKAGEESAQLERALRISLAQGDGWVLQETGLNRLLSLCSTEWCRTEVTGWVNTAKQPVSVSIMPQSGGFNYTVNQYGPGDEDWLKHKLSEYPQSTSVKVVTWANEGQVPGLRGARERGQAIVQAAGQVLVQ